MNCTSEEADKLVNEFWEREWKHIKEIMFPPTREFPITLKELLNEFKNLKLHHAENATAGQRNNSKLIRYFHPSMFTASKGNRPSPMEYWKRLQEDPELFKKFYKNRLQCSDWFNEKNGANKHFLYEGKVPDFIYGIGLTTSAKAPCVSYFKPYLAKYLIETYLNDCDNLLDPFSGYSARLLGAWACNKNYTGIDINDITVQESNELIQFMKDNKVLKDDIEINIKCTNSLSSKGSADAIIACPPYSDKNGKQIEIWQNSKGEKIICDKSCDEIIDYFVGNFDCKKYLFVVDGSSTKYNDYVVEILENRNYINARNGEITKQSLNHEKIVLIEK